MKSCDFYISFQLTLVSSLILPISLLSAVNRMTASNLAIAFGPTLLKSQDEILKFEKNSQVQSVIQEMIESYNEIFKVYIAEELANSKVHACLFM